MNPDRLKLYADLRRAEDVRAKPYDDATGKELKRGDTIAGDVTIAVGRNLFSRGLSPDEIDMLLGNDVDIVVRELGQALPWASDLSEPHQRALAEMAFNLGVPRLLGFPKMLGHLQAREFKAAAAEALNSRWATQVGDRAKRIAAMIKEG